MTLLGLVVVLIVLCIAVYIAKQVPVPFSYIVYAVIVIAVVVILLEVTGVVSGGNVLNRRI